MIHADCIIWPPNPDDVYKESIPVYLLNTHQTGHHISAFNTMKPEQNYLTFCGQHSQIHSNESFWISNIFDWNILLRSNWQSFSIDWGNYNSLKPLRGVGGAVRFLVVGTIGKEEKYHHGASSGWSSVWHCSNTGLSSTQYEQIPIVIFQIWRSSRHSRLPHRRAHYSTEQVHPDRPVWGQSCSRVHIVNCDYWSLVISVLCNPCVITKSLVL